MREENRQICGRIIENLNDIANFDDMKKAFYAAEKIEDQRLARIGLKEYRKYIRRTVKNNGKKLEKKFCDAILKKLKEGKIKLEIE